MRLALVLLLCGCHQRFQREVASLSEVRLEARTTIGPDVDLARAYSVDPGLMGGMAEAYNLSQLMRENRYAAIIADKVDAEQMNAAFTYGIREELGDDAPFRATDAAGAVIRFRVVDWGLEVTGFPFPAVLTYKVRARGELADGRRFYRSSFRCAGDAGEARWLDAYGWSRRDRPRLEDLPATAVQETFDKAAYQCGREFAVRLLQHAGAL